MLATPGNQHIIRQIKTAVASSLRPTAVLLREQPDKPWRGIDYGLLESYQILLEETCPECGQFIWVCRNDDKRLEFKTRSAVCYATRQVEEARDMAKPLKERAKRSEKKDWGKIMYPIPYIPPMYDDQTIPNRSDYYKAEAAKK